MRISETDYELWTDDGSYNVTLRTTYFNDEIYNDDSLEPDWYEIVDTENGEILDLQANGWLDIQEYMGFQLIDGAAWYQDEYRTSVQSWGGGQDVQNLGWRRVSNHRKAIA